MYTHCQKYLQQNSTDLIRWTHCLNESIYLLYVILCFRFSAVVRDKQLCSSWEKKMAAKREKELLKQYSLQLKEEKAKQKEVS